MKYLTVFFFLSAANFIWDYFIGGIDGETTAWFFGQVVAIASLWVVDYYWLKLSGNNF